MNIPTEGKLRQQDRGVPADLDRMVQEGLVTLERAEVRLYRGPAAPRG